MKINRDKFSKYFARFGLIIMAFVLMIPLCSAASPEYDYLLGSRVMSPDFEPVVLDSVPDDISTYYSNNYVTVEPFLYYNAEIVGICPIIQVDDVLYVVACAYMFGTYLYDIQDIESDDPLLNSQLIITGFANDNVAQWVADNSYVPSVTTDITSVWTGILNWITSSLNTVQGLFLTETSGTSGTSVLEAGSYTFNESLIDFPTEHNKVYLGYDVNLGSYGTYQLGITNYYNFSIDGDTSAFTGRVFGIYLPDVGAIELCYTDPAITDVNSNWVISKSSVDMIYGTITNDTSVDSVFADWYIKNTDYLDYHDAPVTNGGGYELTLLGTLAVIGLSIALGFLIIGVIQRFLRLRG